MTFSHLSIFALSSYLFIVNICNDIKTTKDDLLHKIWSKVHCIKLDVLEILLHLSTKLPDYLKTLSREHPTDDNNDRQLMIVSSRSQTSPKSCFVRVCFSYLLRKVHRGIMENTSNESKKYFNILQ